MEEKKLTDEEIIKTLECCDKEECKDCIQCGEFISQFNCMRCAISKALALIHRLQNEKELKAKNCRYLLEENSRQKVLIEQMHKAYFELQKQVDELKNRRIEPKIFQCHGNALENCPKVEQAVKDMAMDFLFGVESQLAYYGSDDTFSKEWILDVMTDIGKRKGVLDENGKLKSKNES